jgi:hypothetical protein
VAQLLGYTNVWEGVIERLDPGAGVSQIRCQNLVVSAAYQPGRLLGDRVGFCVPAAAVKVESSGPVRGELTHQVLSPSTARLFFRLENSTLELECELARERCAELGLSPGRKCALQIPPAAIHVFPAS